jgi:small subunit ribosomal protein S4
MGRYTGPVEKLSRREGIDLMLKGERRAAGKGALERRGATPPGQHPGGRMTRQSVYAKQLREKQAAKRHYGVRERQFRRYFDNAARHRGDIVTGERLLQLLEMRLDNVVYRLGLASTRPQARQFVSHGHVLVDGRRCDIASRQVDVGSAVTLATNSPIRETARQATSLTARVAPWLQADHEELAGWVLREPKRPEIDIQIDEALIVEFYSRV